ncbi:DNA internalization-related competence protein ComEC/Rec2 [Fructilactobacillus cliffordii]|uniref:DNA internalization-related competence protein ComEC/Rec2 n=1 Tax=Fructilactobacillus cliffordii TaxID=2940299 RepID=A0A9Q8ZUG2_9LACO|nr:DNA internalization-related competence protein ComEC/Rec2 [Fructilactobacillus cliffordii]USS89493.1 DNA internalization-related competence protein ComEC/Rec2 [Fructilactobacillus cliffordii]
MMVDIPSGLFLTGIWLLRIWRLHLRHFWWLNVLSLVIPLAVGWQAQQTMQHQTRQMQAQVGRVQTLELVAFPDQVVNTKMSLRGIGELANHQRIFFHGRPLKNQVALQTTKRVRLQVTGTLSVTQTASNWGAFDSLGYARSQGISGDLQVSDVSCVQPAPTTSLTGMIHQWRAWGLAQATPMPKQLRSYVQSLLFGDRTAEFRESSSGIKKLNLIHLFSLAGLHVYVLLNLWMWVATLLHFRKEASECGAMLLLPFYCGMAGGAIGLLRATLTVEQRYWFKLGKLKRSGLDYWSLTLMICLLLNPWNVGQLGFQLSFLLSFTMYYCRDAGNLKKTMILNLVSLPLLLFYFYEWHWLSLAANLIFVPLFTGILFPLILLNYAWQLVFKSTIWGTETVLQWFSQITNWLATAPGSITLGQPPGWIVLVSIMLLLLLMERWSWKRGLCLGGLVVVTVLLIHFPLTGEVSFFDVGQGDGILVREPLNHSVTLIDTGGKPNFFAKQGQPTVHLAPTTTIPYLKSKGISRIDNICLSHQDADHVGDLTSFLAEFKVKRVFIPWGMDQNQHFMRKIQPYLNQTQLLSEKAGQTIPATRLQVLHPFRPGLGENQDSMVLYGQFGGQKFLFTGDLPQDEEHELLNHYPQLRVDVLKLGHYGSKTSSADAFIQVIAPQIGIISAGRNNRYGHPNQETLLTMRRHHVQLFNNQTMGMIRYQYGGLFHEPEFETKWKEIRHGNQSDN